MKTEMDKYGSWKRTEEIEIDVADLLKKICMKWKQVLLCALVCAVVFGGYGYLRARRAQASEISAAENSALLEEIELTEEEQRGVADAIRLENEIKGLEEYLENSILMQADPYHKNKAVMLYRISQAEGKELPGIAESYLHFAVNGGAAEALKESGNSAWDMDKGYLNEVISAYQKTGSVPYQMVMDYDVQNDMPAQTFFYIEVTGSDGGMTEQLAKDMQSVLKDYSTVAGEKLGSHKLSLLGSGINVTADTSLLTQQRDKRSQLSADQASLKAMTDAFSEGQKAVYKNEESTGDGQENAEEAATAESSGINKKYIVLGFAGGIFLYCCVFACWYLLQGTVKTAEEMKERYTFPVYGSIHLCGRAGAEKGKLPAEQQKIQEQAQASNRIRMACKNQEITKICAASDFVFGKQERGCMEKIRTQLKDWGIDAVIIENASADTAVWDTMAEIGKVLLVCKTDVSTHRMIDEAMSFYMENGIEVIGAVVFA